MVKARPCLKIDFQRFKSICATMVPCSILIWIAATFPCVMKKSARAAYGRLLSSATKPAKVARPSRKAAKKLFAPCADQRRSAKERRASCSSGEGRGKFHRPL
eukprot:scaffold51630_cov64-Phaeocystis_antarctica.AAC.2